MTLVENFASRKTVKEKLNDRRIAEPPMNENGKKIRELTEAMHAERDIRIRNKMMAVLGVLKGTLFNLRGFSQFSFLKKPKSLAD